MIAHQYPGIHPPAKSFMRFPQQIRPCNAVFVRLTGSITARLLTIILPLACDRYPFNGGSHLSTPFHETSGGAIGMDPLTPSP